MSRAKFGRDRLKKMWPCIGKKADLQIQLYILYIQNQNFM